MSETMDDLDDAIRSADVVIDIAGDDKSTTSGIIRVLAGRIKAIAGRCRKVEAERDALVEMCIHDRTGDGRWPRGALGPWHCVVTGSHHETRDEAIAALRKAAGPGAAGEAP